MYVLSKNGCLSWPLRHCRYASSDYGDCLSLGTNMLLYRRLLQISGWMENSVDRGCWMQFSKRVNETQNTQLDKYINSKHLPSKVKDCL